MAIRSAVGTLLFFASATACAAGVCGLPPVVPPSQNLIESLMNPPSGADLFGGEIQYYDAGQQQLLQDAVLLFSSTRPQTVYAEFNPADGPPGLDLGYGLKVVKRLDLGDRTIFVNEAWPFARGRFQLPSEIRIRSRVFYQPGDPEGQEGSERQYLNGRFRVGWDRVDQPHLFLEPGYLKPEPGAGAAALQAQRQVRANIYDCMGCHLAGNPFIKHFMTGAEPEQYQSIVQPGYFKLPVAQTLGYQQFMAYLRSQNAPQQELDAFRAAMANPVASFHAMDLRQGMVAALCQQLRSGHLDVLAPDAPFTGDPDHLQPPARKEGIYEDGAALWRDSVDQILEVKYGKYSQWVDNHGTVPPLPAH